MYFHEKLDLVLDVLSIKNVELAREMGMDASLISKLRNGKRGKPASYQKMKDICSAISAFYSEESNAQMLPEELTQLLPNGEFDRVAFYEALFQWLGEGELLPPDRRPTPSTIKVFGERLSALLDVTGVSNAQLARALNVDSSLISLYRKGVRLPSASGSTIERISAYLARQDLRHQQRETLAELIGANDADMDMPVIQRAIHDWLLGMPDDYDDISGVESFLGKVDDFGTFTAGKSVVPVEQIATMAGDVSEPAVFYGNKGLQRAAIKYLYNVVIQDQPRTLHHFSDQSTEWMLADKEFAALWASLMVHMLAKGNVFRIIHTVKRDTTELFSALENWIPLYMIGEIKPLYFRGGESGRIRISHFLAEDLALISGYCAAGAEDKAVFRYDTDPKILTSAREQFEALLPMCGELMKIFKGQNSTDRFETHLNALWGQPGDAAVLQPRLSLMTMPEALLKTILQRAGVGTEKYEHIMRIHAAHERRMFRQLSIGKLDELSAMESKEAIAAGTVFLDIPPHVSPEPIAYTAEEYTEHMNRIHQLEREMPNYKFCPLPVNPFKNIAVFYKQNGGAAVLKMSNPIAAFAFDNPNMCRGIEHFVLEMKKRAEVGR